MHDLTAFLADLPLILTVLSAVALFAACVLSCAATLNRRREVAQDGRKVVAVANEIRGWEDPTADEGGCCYSRDDCDGPDCQCPCHDSALPGRDELAQLASDLVTVAEEWSRSPNFRETAFPRADELMGLAQHVDVEPTPTYGQEQLYNAEGMVAYGGVLVEQRCLDARRDYATDLICEPCAKAFSGVRA